MSKFLSNLASLGFAIEGSRGVAESSADTYVSAISMSVNDVIDKVIDEGAMGVLAEGAGDNNVLEKAECSVEAKVTDESIGYFLKVALGGVTTGTAVDGVYPHVFDFANNSSHPTMTIFRADPVQDYIYPYAVMSSMELSAQLGQYFLMSAEFVAKKGTEGNVTPAHTVENAFLPQHMEVKFADSQSGLDGATAVCANSVSLTIDKGIITDQCLGNVEFTDIQNGKVKVTGTVEMAYQAKTRHDKFVQDGKQAIRIKAVNTAKTIGSGSGHPELTIDLHNAKIQTVNIEYPSGELAKQTIEFAGYYDTATSKLMTATLKNTKASY